MPSSRGSSRSRDLTQVFCIGRQTLLSHEGHLCNHTLLPARLEQNPSCVTWLDPHAVGITSTASDHGGLTLILVLKLQK